MKRPAMSKAILVSLTKAACAVFCLAALLLVGVKAGAQSHQKLVIKSDKASPRKAPEKSTQTTGTTQTTATGTQQTEPIPTEEPPPSDATEAAPDAPQTAAASPSGCVFERILVKDTIRVIFVQLFNYPENSAIPVTVTQTNAGIVGYALTDTGPYTPTVNIVVNTDGNGYGVSQPVFTQGQNVGQTVSYGDTPYGATTTIDFTVLPQCNCPPIPVVQ